MDWNKLAEKVGLPEYIEFPKIDPVPEGVNRPFWSVMIPTYNRTKLLEETIISVLKQAPSPEEMQIEVIDNCSPDVDTEKIVEEIGKGRVSFYRQSYNTGQIGNWNTCINRARGHWVHILHDDDLVLPGFYNRLQSGIEDEPSLGAAFCRHIYMDEDGHWQYLSLLEMRTSGIFTNSLERLIIPGAIQCPAIVVKRNTYEKLGGFYPNFKYMFDMEMWIRIALNYPLWYEPQPLACYRSQTSISGTSALLKSEIPITEGYKLLEVLNSYFPESKANTVLPQVKKAIIIFLMDIIRNNIHQNNLSTAFYQNKELLKYDFSGRVRKGVFGNLILMGKRWINEIKHKFVI
ncbi:glycosyltransferase family 2 protein [Aerosakkonemataceae cyanobacterium BLCC-F154]|uniref:Glycosyltransferase family 2 protein n=2 Tax=Floridanema TaxID=3396149 RepID=A0ABV4YEE7_9CYAN